MPRYFLFIPAMMVTLGIFCLSTFLAIPFQVEEISYFDKWEHLFAYFVLMVSYLWPINKLGFWNRKLILQLMSGAILFGILMEWIQYTFFPDRYFEWYDALANAIGVVLGYFIFVVIKSRNG